ncbi:YrhB domain-containing protein [Bradyrhizobium septentrionale]|uniref:YrhB domain-containing protein n=1 Tax=Bradyrhizobium septentrionale TaxID=1404411 RepID=UPI0030CF51A6
MSKDMLRKSEALELVWKQLELRSSDDVQCVVVESSTIERPFGWIFFYQSKKFLETGIFMHRLAGNGPVFVNKVTGEVDFFGSIPPLEVILAEYEKKLRERG